MHHIVSDGWSMGVLMQELSELYAAFVRGERSRCRRIEVQYADYAVWQRKWMEGRGSAAARRILETALAGAPALLELPTDHPRPAEQDYAAACQGMVLDEGLTAG